MARKPLEALSPAYRRRIERALATGKTRQQARGHKAQEHIIRRERAAAVRNTVAALSLSAAHKGAIRRFARQTALREAGGPDAAYYYGAMLAWAQIHGYPRFAAIISTVREAHRQYSDDMDDGSYESAGGAALEIMADEADAPDPRWFYYH